MALNGSGQRVAIDVDLTKAAGDLTVHELLELAEDRIAAKQTEQDGQPAGTQLSNAISQVQSARRGFSAGMLMTLGVYDELDMEVPEVQEAVSSTFSANHGVTSE